MKSYRATNNSISDPEHLIETGFPSPAADYKEQALSLDELLVRHPSATFYVRAKGDAMQRSGIFDGDLLVVDRSLTARDGDVIIVAVEDQIMVRRLILRGVEVWLATDRPGDVPLRIHQQTEWMIWGMVTHVIHKVQSQKT